MLDLGQNVLKNMPTKNLIGQRYNLLGTWKPVLTAGWIFNFTLIYILWEITKVTCKPCDVTVQREKNYFAYIKMVKSLFFSEMSLQST